MLDLRLPDMSGFELLNRIQRALARPSAHRRVTGKELSAEEEKQLKTVAKSIVLKDCIARAAVRRNSAVPARVVTDLPEAKQRMLERLHSSNEALRNRRVLVVDDDVPNIFALSTLPREPRDRGLSLRPMRRRST